MCKTYIVFHIKTCEFRNNYVKHAPCSFKIQNGDEENEKLFTRDSFLEQLIRESVILYIHLYAFEGEKEKKKKKR